MSVPSAREGFVIGVDVGGTKVAAGLVGPTGEIQHLTRLPMTCDDGPARGLAAVNSAIATVMAKALAASESLGDIQGIGICSPGPLDPKTGIVLNPPNLPCWRNFPLANEIARSRGVPVKLDNDANAAGLAEALWGAGRGYRNVFYATIGTGIGTAILLDRRIYHGRTGAAAEGGHMTIDYRGLPCACGKPGCIESLASGPAIARRARVKLDRGAKSILSDLVRGKLELITSALVGQAYAAGDAVAAETLRETVELLAFWMGKILDLLEPDIMIVGGGAGSLMRPFLPEIHDRLPRCCVNRRCREIPLVPAQYGEDAGVAGGAALYFESVLPANGLDLTSSSPL